MRANITVRRTVAAALAAPMLAFVAAGTADAAPQTTTSLARQTAVTSYVQGGGGGFGGIGGFRGGNFGFYGSFVPVPVVVPVVVPVGGFGGLGGFGGGFFPFR